MEFGERVGKRKEKEREEERKRERKRPTQGARDGDNDGGRAEHETRRDEKSWRVVNEMVELMLAVGFGLASFSLIWCQQEGGGFYVFLGTYWCRGCSVIMGSGVWCPRGWTCLG